MEQLPLCVLCRRPNPTPASSACPTCIPPDEGEIRAQGKVAALEAELNTVHAACMEHVRIRNEIGEQAAELRQALTRLACYAATAKHANTFEWMLDLVEHLNRTAVTLNEPTQFIHRKNQATGEMWITAEAIP